MQFNNQWYAPPYAALITNEEILYTNGTHAFTFFGQFPSGYLNKKMAELINENEYITKLK